MKKVIVPIIILLALIIFSDMTYMSPKAIMFFHSKKLKELEEEELTYQEKQEIKSKRRNGYYDENGEWVPPVETYNPLFPWLGWHEIKPEENNAYREKWDPIATNCLRLGITIFIMAWVGELASESLKGKFYMSLIRFGAWAVAGFGLIQKIYMALYK